MKWRYLNTGLHSGLFNMEFDESLAAHLINGTSPPVLRVYGWNPHAISVGRHQSKDIFDRAALSGAGIDIVRRPTGGKAILHADELTYSVVTPCPADGLRELYRRINLGLLEGLRLLGIDAELTAENTDFRKLYADPTSLACFSSSAKSEIRVNGRKLIGSAQRRYGSVVLQHGSFLLSNRHREITRFLGEELASQRESIRTMLEESTIDALAILRREITFEEAADAIREGCSRTWEVEFIEESPPVPDEHLILN